MAYRQYENEIPPFINLNSRHTKKNVTKKFKNLVNNEVAVQLSVDPIMNF